MTKAASVLKQLQKDFGEKAATKGAEYVNPPRLPTGIFPFDLSTGGGFPLGRVSMVYGPESSGKTNLVLKAIAQHQKLYPELAVAFVDMENCFDPHWAKKLGVNTEELIMMYPAYAEQCVDMVEALLEAEDCGLIVIDSIAAMITAFETESSAEKALVGGNALVVGKLGRKIVYRLGEARRQGRHPAVICVNQIRYKIGVMYGDPETQPGGKTLPFTCSLIARLYGKNEMDKAVSKTMPIMKVTSTILKKWKMPVVSVNSEYRMAALPHKNLSTGDIDDWNTISSYLRDYGWLVKGEKGGWELAGNQMKTLEECRKALIDNPEFGMQLRQKIIEKALSEANGLPEEFTDEGVYSEVFEGNVEVANAPG